MCRGAVCESACRAKVFAAADVHLGLKNVSVFFEIFAVKFRLSGHPAHPVKHRDKHGSITRRARPQQFSLSRSEC
jgi:hypothetical protein